MKMTSHSEIKNTENEDIKKLIKLISDTFSLKMYCKLWTLFIAV